MNSIIKYNEDNKKVIDIKNKYIDFKNKLGSKSSKILFLVPNNKVKYKYDELLKFDFSEEIKTTTYMSFITKEVIKYWSIIDAKCKNIKKHKVRPDIISSNLSEYIINEIVKEKRNTDNYFEDITASNRNISTSILNNINKASESLMDLTDIGNKIYYSKANRDKIDRFSYSQMQEIIDSYIRMLLENSMVDNAMLNYLYNEYLLKDDIYIKQLTKSIDYLIVYSLESCNTSCVNLIHHLLESIDESVIYINESKDYAAFNNIDMSYLKSNLFNKCTVIDNSNLDNVNIENIKKLNIDIKLNQSNQLYSSMIYELCEKVIELINDGNKSSDIAIISPMINTVLDYQIKSILANKNIDIYSTKQDKRVIDYPYAHALMVAGCIFYNCEELLNDEDYINFISLLLDTNKIRATKILKDKNNYIEYVKIISYIEDKKSTDINIYEFLIKFYIDKLLNLSHGKENVKICKRIIQESESFTENIKNLGFDKKKSKEKIFIEALKMSIKDYYLISELDELSNEDFVVLTTPYTYISHNMKKPIQIWVDIGSNMWSMKSEKEISNVHVLKKSFDNNRVYTEDIEEFYKEYYLNNTIYNLLLNTQKVYAYKSEYTVNGYIQEGNLYGLILKLISEGDFNE